MRAGLDQRSFKGRAGAGQNRRAAVIGVEIAGEIAG